MELFAEYNFSLHAGPGLGQTMTVSNFQLIVTPDGGRDVYGANFHDNLAGVPSGSVLTRTMRIRF
jgi:hypothetical protein